MRKKITSLIILLLFLTALEGCASLKQLVEPKAKVTTTGGPNMAQAQKELYNGPKARIAVARFSDSTAKGWWTGEIGNGMADMLATSLFNSNRFIVLERRTLEDVIAEQDLAASGRVNQETAAPIGKIEGAELLISGAVTAFELGAAGIGGGIGGISGSWQEAVAGIILGSIKRSHVAIDVRVIDTATSRILCAASVEGKDTDFSLGGGGFGSHVGGGLGVYSNTPVEKTIRVALNEAVNFIISQTPAQYYHCSDNDTPQKTSDTDTYQKFSEPKNVYVRGAKANIREGAGTQYTIITTATKGDSFIAIGENGEWYHLNLPNGQEGWVSKSLITFDKPLSSSKKESPPDKKDDTIAPM